MAIEDEPEVLYEASDGISKIPCSLQQAQLWLLKGYFTSDTRFALRTTGGKEGEWTTLEELVKRNGLAVPFSDWCASEEEREEDMKELERLNQEMVELKERKENLQRAINKAMERRATVQNELDRIALKLFPAPPPVVYAQIAPPTGVDPFALLKSCEGARRKMGSDFESRFKQLLNRFDRCDKKRLVQQTSELFAAYKVRMCWLCNVKIISTSVMLMHMCCGKHIGKMSGSVCADAFDYWWNAVDTVLGRDTVLEAEVSKEGGLSTVTPVESSIDRRPSDTVPCPSKEEQPTAIFDHPQIYPPPGVNPFALLKSCEGAAKKLQGNIMNRIMKLRARYDKCDKSRLRRHTRTLINKIDFKMCSLCSEMIVSVPQMLVHICSVQHIDAMRGSVCADAFDFLWSAVDTVLAGDTVLKAEVRKEGEVTTVTPVESSIDRRPSDTVSYPSEEEQPTAIFDHPQIYPPPGVDPFALLKSCEGAARKLGGDLESRFSQLLYRVNRCDKKRLVQQTSELFAAFTTRMCWLCNVKIVSIVSMLIHLCGKHIGKMLGSACADAFDFWWNAVNTVLGGDTVLGVEVSNEGGGTATVIPIESSIDRHPSDTVPCPSKEEQSTIVDHPQIYPLPGVDPFALLKSCEGAARKVQGDLFCHFIQLRERFDRCDKKRLEGQTSEIFENYNITECTLCQLKIDSPNKMMEHICGREHIFAMQSIACADAFDFWSTAVEIVLEMWGSREMQRMGLATNKHSPPPEVDPLALLRSCEGAVRKMGGDIENRFRELHDLYLKLDKKDKRKIDRKFLALFPVTKEEARMCSLCEGKLFSAGVMITHVCSEKHIGNMGGSVCADTFDFWWNAVKTVWPKHSATSSVSPSVVYPQIYPPPGVDPFALLKSCEGARRKVPGDLEVCFKQLLMLFNQCKKRKLAHRTSELLSKHNDTECSLCQLKIASVNDILQHICGGKHILSMGGNVCADAFDFWWNTVEEVTTVKKRTVAKPAFDGEDPSSNQLVTQKGNQNGLVILQRTPIDTKSEPVKFRYLLYQLKFKHRSCDKNYLDNDPTTMGLFEKPVLCMICNRGEITSASELVSHVTSSDHWDAIIQEKCGLPRKAVYFWIGAVERAST